MPLLLLIFQDDLLEISVGPTARTIIETVECNFIPGDPAVELSPKTDVNRPFATTFEFMGAEFDTFNRKHIKQRPTPHAKATIDEDFEWVISHRIKLVSRERLQIAIGRFTFCPASCY